MERFMNFNQGKDDTIEPAYMKNFSGSNDNIENEIVKEVISRTITTINIPDGTTKIGAGAFQWCDSLTSVIIPDSVTSIDVYSFGHCYNLTNVIIGKGVTKIETYAFQSCSNLREITIPNNVTTISGGAFDSYLRTITIEKPENSISGAPWGATNATVVWTG